MSLSRMLKTATAVAFCTATTTQAALAAGEQKNIRPFTDPAKTGQSTSNASIPASTVARGWTAVVGDAKNLQPFTRPLAVPATVDASTSQNHDHFRTTLREVRRVHTKTSDSLPAAAWKHAIGT
jgi:hypothetical protein